MQRDTKCAVKRQSNQNDCIALYGYPTGTVLYAVCRIFFRIFVVLNYCSTGSFVRYVRTHTARGTYVRNSTGTLRTQYIINCDFISTVPGLYLRGCVTPTLARELLRVDPSSGMTGMLESFSAFEDQEARAWCQKPSKSIDC